MCQLINKDDAQDQMLKLGTLLAKFGHYEKNISGTFSGLKQSAS